MTATQAADLIALCISRHRPANEHKVGELYRELELTAEPTSPLGKAFGVMRDSESTLTVRGSARIYSRMMRNSLGSAA